MQLSPNEAKQTLDNIDDIMRRVKQRIGMGNSGYIIMIWGVIWIACFAVPFWWPRMIGTGWLIGNVIGFASTFTLSAIDARKKRVISPEIKSEGKRMGWAWFSMFLFIDAMLVVIYPFNGAQLGTLLVIMIMMMYVLMGLWMKAGVLVVTGWLIGIMAVGGYMVMRLQWFPRSEWLLLWHAVFCGGPLFLSGLYIKLRWR